MFLSDFLLSVGEVAQKRASISRWIRRQYGVALEHSYPKVTKGNFHLASKNFVVAIIHHIKGWRAVDRFLQLLWLLFRFWVFSSLLARFLFRFAIVRLRSNFVYLTSSSGIGACKSSRDTTTRSPSVTLRLTVCRSHVLFLSPSVNSRLLYTYLPTYLSTTDRPIGQYFVNSFLHTYLPIHLRYLSFDPFSITFVTFSLIPAPEGKALVTGSLDGSVRVWDPKSGNCIHAIMGECSESREQETREKWGKKRKHKDTAVEVEVESESKSSLSWLALPFLVVYLEVTFTVFLWLQPRYPENSPASLSAVLLPRWLQLVVVLMFIVGRLFLEK